ncbi:MAG TPA: LysM peptidoglycan-binding domain-containing protein [Anaerolineales bacterium]|nr:LysM peptidoglycan-binding domain-containing protein [Anaerolineales bacterium]
MSVNETIESYRKRRNQMTPLLLGGLALVLVVVGIIIVVTSLHGGGLAKLLATKTPTPTVTPTVTDTPAPTDTVTVTASPTVTPTGTPSAPQNYVVQEGDTLTSIVNDHNLGKNGLILIYMLNPLAKDPTTGATTGIDPSTGFITVGETIIIPNPGMQLPTATPLPTGLFPGSRITYQVLPGDSLAGIAIKMNSTVAAIVAANQAIMKKDGANTVLYQGEVIVVPIDLVTPVPTKRVTPTPTPTATP